MSKNLLTHAFLGLFKLKYIFGALFTEISPLNRGLTLKVSECVIVASFPNRKREVRYIAL